MKHLANNQKHSNVMDLKFTEKPRYILVWAWGNNQTSIIHITTLVRDFLHEVDVFHSVGRDQITISNEKSDEVFTISRIKQIIKFMHNFHFFNLFAVSSSKYKI